jgi:CRP-like cAMP-binding protein
MTRDECLHVLRQTQLFRTVAPGALQALAEHAVPRRLVKGEVLFCAGEPARGLYIVASGAVRAFRVAREGREQTMHIERAVATLAEVPAFDGGPYPSTAMAEEDTTVLFLANADLQQFLLQNPEAALAAMAIMARRLREMASLVERLALQDVAQRLAGMLIEEAERNGPVVDGASFSLPESHRAIAARIGSVREVVARNLHRLTEQRLISVHGHCVTILNAAQLRAIAGI